MATPDFRTPPALRVARTFAAPREKVFRAWTDPQAVKHWFLGESEGHWTQEPDLDARTGGGYRFTGTSEGKPWCIHGTYLEVKAPERLVFTWEWEDYPAPGDSGDTLVTVKLFERGGQTEVVLTHEKFATEAARQDHATGWVGCLDAMAKVV